jgi:hypothetical protein
MYFLQRNQVGAKESAWNLKKCNFGDCPKSNDRFFAGLTVEE